MNGMSKTNRPAGVPNALTVAEQRRATRQSKWSAQVATDLIRNWCTDTGSLGYVLKGPTPYVEVDMSQDEKEQAVSDRDLIPVWRGGDLDDAPVPMHCQEFGYPHRTVDGEQMRENTHFRTRAEAWASILRSARADVILTRVGLEGAVTWVQATQVRLDATCARLERVLRMIPGDVIDAQNQKREGKAL